MIEVAVESIRVSLINQSRLVVLRQTDSPRYLSIWIGAFEADAITIGLQEADVPRPLTHSLIGNIIAQLGGRLKHILINDLRGDTFFAELHLETEAGSIMVDARPSDAIAVAVRSEVPIFVSDEVMESAGQEPAPEYELEGGGENEAEAGAGTGTNDDEPETLDVFRDFLETLDFGDDEE